MRTWIFFIPCVAFIFSSCELMIAYFYFFLEHLPKLQPRPYSCARYCYLTWYIVSSSQNVMKVQLPNPSHLFSEIISDCGDSSRHNEEWSQPVSRLLSSRRSQSRALQCGRAPTSPGPPPTAMLCAQWPSWGSGGGWGGAGKVYKSYLVLKANRLLETSQNVITKCGLGKGCF